METRHNFQKTWAGIGRHLKFIEVSLNKARAARLDWPDTAATCQLLNISKRTLAHYRVSGIVP